MTSFLSTEITHDRQPGGALVMWLPVFLGLGTGIYFLLPMEPAPIWGYGFLACCLVGAAVTLPWRGSLSWRYLAAFFILASFGLVGAQHRTHAVDTKLLGDNYFGTEVSGTIAEMERMGTGWRVVLNPAHIEKDEASYVLRLTVRQRDFHPILGGSMQARASLMPPSPPLVPGMYDFQRHAYFQRIGGYGYVTKVLHIGTAKLPAVKANPLENYRDFLAGQVYKNLHQPEAGIVTALLNGQRGGITQHTTQSLQQSGLQHIISISGLHVGLMAGIVFFIVRLLLVCSMTLALTWPVKKIAACAAMAAIIAYMLVVGQDPATLRSVIMTSIVLFAVLIDREAINLRLVAIAALFLIILRPESILDIGFQLSFAAVTALVAFYQYTHDFWQHAAWRNSWVLRVIRPVLIAALTTIIATLSTAPLVFVHFQQVPLLSLIANALATPVVAFIIMPGTFLSYMLTPFPFLGDWAIRLMGFGVTLLLKIAYFVAALPWAVWRIPAIPFTAALLLMFGMFILFVMRGKWRWAAVAPCLCAALILVMHASPDLLATGNRVILMPDRAEGILYAEGRMDGFSKKLFLQYTGTMQVKNFPCEGDLCVLDRKGRKITLIRTVPALKQACEKRADVILTRYYLDRPCAFGRLIDRHVTEERGGVLIGLNPLDVKTVYASSDRRPWQKTPVKYDRYATRGENKARLGKHMSGKSSKSQGRIYDGKK